MITSYLIYAAFFLICLVLVTLPFVPAFREWRYPSDFAALPVSADYSIDVAYFAQRLQADAAGKLGLGASTGYGEFEFVNEPIEGINWSDGHKRLISKSSIETGKSVRNRSPVYVQGSIGAGAESSFSALYAAGDITLGAQSEISDWAHADGVMRIGANSIALRRLSAGVAIELGNEAWFERLNAPTLRFGLSNRNSNNTSVKRAEVNLDEASLADLPGAIKQTASLFLIRGDCALPPQKIYRGSLVVSGFLTIGQGTTVVGDIKARSGVSIGRGASVKGAVTCERRVYVFREACVLGPLICESDVLIGASAVIGQLFVPTTVSANNIIVEMGAIVHGTIWAHEIGMVKSA